MVLPSSPSCGWSCLFPSSVGWCCLVPSSFGPCCFSPLLLCATAFVLLLWVGLLFTCLLLGGAAWSTPPWGGVASCFVSSSSFGRCCFFPLLWRGAAFLPLLWVGPRFTSPVEWCCLVSSFGWCCFPFPSCGKWCFSHLLLRVVLRCPSLFCMVLPSFSSFGVGLRSPSLQLGPALSPNPLGGVAFPISSGCLPSPPLSGATFSLSSVGWCCLVSCFFGRRCCFSNLLLLFHHQSSVGWCCFFPSSEGWCCLVSFFFGWCCFSPLLCRAAAFLPLLWVGLLSFHSFG